MFLREVTFEDYTKIKKLVTKSKKNIQDYESWKKIWSTNPLLKKGYKIPLGWIIEKNQEVVGYLGNFPKVLKHNDKEYLASCITTWVVDDQYRSVSILLINQFFNQKEIDIFICTTAKSAVNKIWKALGAMEMPLVSCQEVEFVILNSKKFINGYIKKKFNLPNFFTYLFILLFKMTFIHKLNFRHFSKINHNYKILDRVDEDIHAFLKKIDANNYRIKENKNKDWLSWNIERRILDKEVWSVKIFDKNSIIGYCLCIGENLNHIDLKRVYLADLEILDENNTEAFKDLIKISILESKKRNYDVIEFKNLNNYKKKFLKKFNFFKRKFKSNPYLYKFKENSKNFTYQDHDLWDISLLDGDNLF